MYHALVLLHGVWTSFGLHISSNHWSNFFNSLKRAYGEDKVAYTFHSLDENFGVGYDLERRIREEVSYAKVVQDGRNNGIFPAYDEDGHELSLAYGIAHLRDLVVR